MGTIGSLLGKFTQVFSSSVISSVQVDKDESKKQSEEIVNRQNLDQKNNLTLEKVTDQVEENDLFIIKPTKFAESLEMIDRLKDNKAVLLNLTTIEYQIAEEIINFMSGAIYALDGHVEKIDDAIFLFTPKFMNITYSEQSPMTKNGLSKQEKESLYG